MKKIIFVLLALFLLTPAAVFAAEFRSQNEPNASLIFGKNETAKNLYAGGGTIEIDGAVMGDLVAGGGTININNNIESGLISGGGTLNIKGNVGKSSRIAGGTITISGKTGEDLAVAGGTITLNKDAEVGGDLLLAGGDVRADNNVKGRVFATGGTIVINGEINGDVTLKNVEYLTIGENAKINGKLKYSSPNEAEVRSGSEIDGGTEYQKINVNQKTWEQLKPAGILFSMLMTFLILVIFVSIFRRYANNVVNEAAKNSLVKIGWGIFSVIAFPVAVLFLCVTIIGLKLALLLGLIYVLFLLIASFLSPLIVGSYLAKSLKLNVNLEANWISIVIGILALGIVRLIPFVGPLVVAAAFLLSLGQISTDSAKLITTESKK